MLNENDFRQLIVITVSITNEKKEHSKGLKALYSLQNNAIKDIMMETIVNSDVKITNTSSIA